MTGRRFFWSTIEDTIPFTPLIDSSIASYGLIRLYDESGLDAIRLVNDDSLAEADIPWNGEKPDISDINSHLGVDGGFVKALYDQKSNIGGSILGNNATQSTWPILNLNGGGTDKPSAYTDNAPTNYLQATASGTNIAVLFANCSYSVCVIATKIDVLSGDKDILGVETRTPGTALSIIRINPTNSGGLIFGRYTNGVAGVSVNFTYDFTTGDPVVITGIFDYVRRELIIRINGVELAKSTVFASGTRSENANIGRVQIGRFATTNGCKNNFFGATFFRSAIDAEAPPISEIQAVENRYMTYLGI